MNLLDFQKNKVDELYKELTYARKEYNDLKKPQVVSFAACTGAGKTVMMAALIERVFSASKKHLGEKEPIFVWLSDSPQLNEQSRDKISLYSRMLSRRCATIRDDSKGHFDKEFLEEGHIYFLNTQKLGKKSNLRKKGDNRNYTIWETLANTVEEKGDHLYFIIDEAHRGAQDNDEEEATTIMQKFLKGSKEDGLPKMPIVIGMSATTKRFDELVAGINNSNIRKCDVPIDDVCLSGLLKDRIVIVHSEDEDGARRDEFAILQAAAKDWNEKRNHWRRYCQEQRRQGEPSEINPILVVQVLNVAEGKNSSTPSKTNLDECLRTIEACCKLTFKQGEVVHAFGQEYPVVKMNGLDVRDVEPSAISGDPKIQVVFFKEKLSTGWDCPRAETMMSFRHAGDETYIAQLLGRMVRAPLQHHIEGDEVLNDVHLYLPNFSKEAAAKVASALQSGGCGVRKIDVGEVDTLAIDEHKGDKFNRKSVLDFINKSDFLSPRVRNIKIRDYVKSLMALADFLSRSEYHKDAVDEVHGSLIEKMHEYIENLKENNKYDELVEKEKRIKIKTSEFDASGEKIEIEEGFDDDDEWISATDSGIRRWFDDAEQKLGGDGIGQEYGDKYYDANDENAYRLDVILYTKYCYDDIVKYAEITFNEFVNKYRLKILDKDREEFDRICYEGSIRIEDKFRLPTAIKVPHKTGGTDYKDHLFVDEERGVANIKLGSSWEIGTLEEERRHRDFVYWIRNLPQAKWALSIPYDDNGVEKQTYPDLIIIRKGEGQREYTVDILEPHGDKIPDNLPKAKGFVEYAKSNQMIGRIQLIREVGNNQYKRLDMSKREVQAEVLKAKSKERFDEIFEKYGTFGA